MTDVTQKLICASSHATFFVDARLPHAMLRLLSNHEMSILQGALEILGRLSDWSPPCRTELCASTAIDLCLQLIPEGDILTQKLCVSLLRILSCEEQVRQQILIYDGVPLLVGLLSVRNPRLQWHVTWCLAQLADDLETCAEIAQLGGINLLFSLLDPTPPERAINDWVAMLSGVCALLSQLCQVDSNQQLMVNCNGVFLLGRLILLPKLHWKTAESPAIFTLQCSIFRVLRLLFSLERNRFLFKKAFETRIFEHFIDIGHYVQDLARYRELVELYNTYMDTVPAGELPNLWDTVNQRREPLGRVGEFELLDRLGSGAFGCVYTVRKQAKDPSATPQYFALKEIYMVQLKQDEADKSFGDIISEVKIIKQQLRHPNIVRYRRIFVENNRLYIVMDLIEGASLKEHITSIKEKRETFPEERIWNMLIQMVLALRYLHKDKQIVHRDLKPNNIMITDNDRLVITDFGLAKQKGADYLKSAAGTIVYSCPEIVQNLPYGEKSDIWSLGCCVYEMAALKPAFYSQNMLQLATHIVEGTYEEVVGYSREMSEIIASCLTVSPIKRPDILGVSSLMTSRLLLCLDDIFRIHASNTKSGREERSVSASSSQRKLSSLNSSSNSTSGIFSSEKTRPEKKSVPVTVLPPLATSIDKPRRSSAKSQSAGQPSRRGSLSISCSLPRIAAIRNDGKTTQRTRRRSPVRTSSLIPKRAWSSSSGDVRNKTEGVTVRSAALRPVADPVLRILDQIHKVLLITSSAPSESMNHKRRLVEQYKRKVFSKQSSAEMIKTQFRKLAAEVPEEIDLDLGFADFRPVLADIQLRGYELDHKITRITYEQLAQCMSILLKEAQ